MRDRPEQTRQRSATEQRRFTETRDGKAGDGAALSPVVGTKSAVEDSLERRALQVAGEEFAHALDRLDGVDPATATVLARLASWVATGVVPSVDEPTSSRSARAALELFGESERDARAIEPSHRE